MKLVDYHMNEAFDRAGLDLTKEQMVVLKKLDEQDGLNQNELAYLTYRNKSSLTRLLAKMESKKYIRRRQGKTDKRVNQVFLTDEGKGVYQKTRPVIKSLITKMERNISDQEKTEMIALLKRVQRNFEPMIDF